MNAEWIRSWRWALPLAAALALVACTEAAAPPSQPGGGGKADSPFGNEIADSAMEVLPERPGLIDLARDPESRWTARLVGPGGDLYLTSTLQTQEPAALNAILGMKENGVLLERYRTVTTESGCALELRAANHQVIATGPTFATCEEASAAIAATRDLVAGVVQFEAAVEGGARFDLWREAADGKWRFVLRAADRRVLLASQTYSRRTDAVGGLLSVRANGKLLQRYRTVPGAGGVFVSLRAQNGQEIASGGPYASATEAEAVIDESVQLLASERVGNPW